MKKLTAVFLMLAMLLAVVGAFADTWTCPECGKEGEGNFCSWCGTKKPAEKVVCPSCGAEFDADAGFAFCNNCGASLTAAVTPDTPAPGAVEIGSIITFGTYEQDNDTTNGAEPLEWIVLDVQDGKALLLSKYGLEAMAYNKEAASVTWETCTIRAWLNSDFIDTAFTPDEKAAIQTTLVDNTVPAGFSSDGGKNTEDLVFLLSYQEAFDTYFSSNSSRMCAPTDYANAQGAWSQDSSITEGRAAAPWWLRTPGEKSNDTAVSIFYDGTDHTGGDVDFEGLVVRPALWADVSGI